MIILYQDSPVSIYGFNYQLGGLRRDLTQLKTKMFLQNTEEALSAMGYRYCLSLDKNETLLSLAANRSLPHWHRRQRSALWCSNTAMRRVQSCPSTLATRDGLREITILQRQYCRN